MRIVGAALILLWCAAPLAAATRYDPRLRFKTIVTPRFTVYFHQGEEAEARRLAGIAERVASELDATLGRASGRVHVILVNQTDLPNGWATPIPYNLIEITAAAPGGESSIGNTDDWLRLVFTHEYTHVVHLSRARGWIGSLQRALGRHPLLYPNLFLPVWAIEGIATYEESAMTGYGRLHAADFTLIARTAAATRRVDPLDRVNGGLVDWPAGSASYVYGASFNEFLAKKYGPESLRRLMDETAGRLPYLGTPAFRKVFGRSLGELWTDFEKDLGERAPPASGAAARLTHHGFEVGGPRYSRDGTLYYSIANQDGFPALMALDPGADRPREVVTRFLGTRVAFAGGNLVFDQMEIEANVGLQSDLFSTPTRGGGVTRLTRGARAADPDVSPDGTTIVCTLQGDDRRELALLPARSGAAARPRPLVSEPLTDFTAPRWSPDGRSVVVERHRRGRTSEVVVVDAASGAIRVVAAAPDARNITPIWTADGRAVIFASDRGGSAFRIYRAAPDGSGLRVLEGTGATATSPALSPDGRTLAFVGYTADGYDLFSLPLAGARWTAVAADSDRRTPVAEYASPDASPVQPYSPLRTLAPRFWTPTVESDHGEVVVGAAVGGADALGRQGYGVEAGWAGSRARPDWQVAYAYDRWWPTLFADFSDDTDPFRAGEIRTTELNAGVLLPFRRIRWSQSVLAAFHASRDSAECAACDPPISARADRRSLRTGWSYTSAKSYGYSITSEEGWSATATTEWTRAAWGSDGDAGAASLDLRSYVRLGPRHAAIAARAAGAAAWGDEEARREFSAAGSSSQPGGYHFGFDAIGLLRGFDEDAVRGQHAAVLNVDYRVPLVWIERGVGTIPVFVRSLHAAGFFDGGHAWGSHFDLDDARFSTGAELSMDVVLAYGLPLTLSSGIAWRHDGTGRESGAAAFARIGRAF
jgi:WD40 repeat protein